MDIYARSTGDTTEIYTVEECACVLAVLAAAIGMITALLVVVVLWSMGIGINAALVGAVAGGMGGAAAALLALPNKIR